MSLEYQRRVRDLEREMARLKARLEMLEGLFEAWNAAPSANPTPYSIRPQSEPVREQRPKLLPG